MSFISSLLFTTGAILRALCELVRCALRFGWVMMLPRTRLAARVLAAESQLAVELNRSGVRKRRRRFTPAFRLLWAALSKLLGGWEELVHLMKPETVVSRHRELTRHRRPILTHSGSTESGHVAVQDAQRGAPALISAGSGADADSGSRWVTLGRRPTTRAAPTGMVVQNYRWYDDRARETRLYPRAPHHSRR